MLAVVGVCLAGVVIGIVAGMGLVGDDEDDGTMQDELAGREGQIVAFLTRDITEDQQAAVEAAIAGHPDVAAFAFVDQEQSNDELRRLFEDNPEMLERAEHNPDLVPTSYRIVPAEWTLEDISAVESSLRDMPGVLRVTHASEPPPG
jgi:cell division protein FtsX